MYKLNMYQHPLKAQVVSQSGKSCMMPKHGTEDIFHCCVDRVLYIMSDSMRQLNTDFISELSNIC